MSESILHKTLVQHIIRWIQHYEREIQFVFVDCAENMFMQNIPPLVREYRPDVYVTTRQDNRVYIGEAKATLLDLESKHSREQYLAYLNYCMGRNGILVIAVPWELANRAKSLIYNLQRQYTLTDVKVEIVDLFQFWGH